MLVHIRELRAFKLEKNKMEKKHTTENKTTTTQIYSKMFPYALDKNS